MDKIGVTSIGAILSVSLLLSGCGGGGGGSSSGQSVPQGVSVTSVSPKNITPGVATTITINGVFNEPGNDIWVADFSQNGVITYTAIQSIAPNGVSSQLVSDTEMTITLPAGFTAVPGVYDIQVTEAGYEGKNMVSTTSAADQVTFN
jgi:hypothetical protein